LDSTPSTTPPVSPYPTAKLLPTGSDCSCTIAFKEIDLLFKLEKDSAKESYLLPWTIRHSLDDRKTVAATALIDSRCTGN